MVFLTLVVLLAGCGEEDSTSGPGDPSPPPEPEYDLLFEGTRDSIPELWLRDAGTGAIRRVLAPGVVAKDPAPTPDGSRIAFVVSDEDEGIGDIFVAQRYGSGLAQLTHAGALDDQPAWSPDGTRIAFRSFRTERDGDIWVMRADGANPVNLTPDPLPGVLDERRPAWSPDGTRIVFATNAAGNVDLWIMNRDGGDPRQLTGTIDLDTEPAWSPDGAWIAFRRSSNVTGSDICVVPAAGGEVVRLSHPGIQRLPAWSPDGRQIVYVEQPTTNARPDLYSMRPDGTERTPLVTTEMPGGSLHPAFLRRVRKIAGGR